MSNIIAKHTGLLILAVLILISCQIGLAAASSVSVSPQMTTASHGDIFTIEIIADPAGSEVFGAECTLYFDNTVLKATDQTIGTFLSHDGTDTIEVLNNINNDIGKIEYGETRIGDPEVIGGVTNTGILVSVTFEVIGSGTSDLELEAMLADSGAQPIDAAVNSGTCSVDGVGEPSTGRETPASTEHPGQTQENNGLPGFGIVCSVIGLIAASSLMFKKGLK